MKCFRCCSLTNSVYVIDVSELKRRAETKQTNVKNKFCARMRRFCRRRRLFRRRQPVWRRKTCVTRGIDGRHARACACRPSIFTTLATSLLDGFHQHFQATVHTSKQGRRLTQQHQSYFSKNNSKLSWKKLWEHWDSNPGRLGGKRERYLCAMPTPLN